MNNRITETSPNAWLAPLAAQSAGIERARHSVDLALRCLGGVEPTEDVIDLVERAQKLRDEIDQWSSRPPSPEMREAVMRGTLSIQMAAMALLRKS
jgi:hypothetical protein